MPNRSSRPRDTNQLAKAVVDLATGDAAPETRDLRYEDETVKVKTAALGARESARHYPVKKRKK
jgi:hypothetical protein